jgi:hypothetical protein
MACLMISSALAWCTQRMVPFSRHNTDDRFLSLVKGVFVDHPAANKQDAELGEVIRRTRLPRFR